MNTARRLEPHDDATVALWRLYRASGDPRARTQLLDGYLGLVHHAAREVLRRGARMIDHDELVSAGTVGLVQALEGFDPERGQAFSTYAMPRIRGAILDELRALDWRSRGGRSRVRALDRAQIQLEQRFGRSPDPQDVAAALNIDMDTYWRWNAERDASQPVTLSLVESGSDSERLGLAEQLADPSVKSPDELLAREQAIASLRQTFRGLPEKDRLVLALSFEEDLSLREIAEILHVTESRISQIRKRAIQRLREAMTFEEDPS